jgi:outer membrane protein assembly factor BamB
VASAQPRRRADLLGGTNPKIYSVDAATGRVVWRSTASTIGPPAVVGNRVYAADEGGALFAKDVTNGVNRWIGNGRVGSRTSPPSVGGGRVFTVNDEGHVNVYAAAGCGALRCGTLWRAQVPGDRMWRSTPAVGKTTIFVGGHNRLDALDAATGKRRWAGLVDEPNVGLTSPTIAHGVIYVASSGDRLHAFPAPAAAPPPAGPSGRRSSILTRSSTRSTTHRPSPGAPTPSARSAWWPGSPSPEAGRELAWVDASLTVP